MMQYKITDTEGKHHMAARTAAIPEDVDAVEFLDKRTSFDVESVVERGDQS